MVTASQELYIPYYFFLCFGIVTDMEIMQVTQSAWVGISDHSVIDVSTDRRKVRRFNAPQGFFTYGKIITI